MAVNDILIQLKNAVLGVKSNEIDKIIDSSLDQISKYSSNNDNNKFIDAFKSLIKTTNSQDTSFIKTLDNGNPQVQTYDQSGRIGRYQEYDSVCAKIPYCQRALETWVDHIVSPDDILKTTLEILVPDDEENDNNKLNRTRKRITTLIEHFQLENKTKNIVRTTLKKGDCFVELVVTKNGRNTLVVLNESQQSDYDFLRKRYKFEDGEDKRNISVVVESGSQLINFGGPFAGLGTLISSPNYPNLMRNQQDISGIPEWSKDSSKSSQPEDPVEKRQFKGRYDDKTKEEFDKEKEKNDEKIAVNDLSVVVHDPKYVIRLETQRYKVCLGYLVFPKTDVIQMVTGGVTNNIDALCAQLLGDIKTKLGMKDFNDKIEIDDDIRNVLFNQLKKISKNEDLKIRYVAPEFMTHFRLDTSKYYPYGESIFDCVLFQCRLYIALQTALTTKKINAASDKRFINIEMGLPRDAAQLVERMKDAITKKKISVGTLGNIDTIPSQISTFETIYLPQKDGKRFIEIDNQQWGGDTSNDADQLKTIRDGIVGSLGVPSAYLNIEENSSNRSILTTESINFCRCVISKQQDLSIPLWEFFYKAFVLVWGKQEADLLRNIKITFQQPKISPAEHFNEVLQNTSAVISSLTDLGIPREYLKRKLLPYIDWDDVENYITKEKLAQETGDQTTSDNSMMGGMGMGGMDMGMGGMGADVGMGGMPPM